MSDQPHQADHLAVRALLLEWLASRLAPAAHQWLTEKAEQVLDGSPEWIFFTSFSGATRYTGKAELNLTVAEQAAATALRPNWHPETWSVDEAARAAMALSVPASSADAYLTTLNKVFDTADVGESVALYQCLPVFPFADAFRARASEGTRTNMTSVFEAVAVNNPYPAEYFDENSWNQLVLKGCFVNTTLHGMLGLDQRANPALAQMLVDFAHERWAAGRTVSPDLWRPVGPFAEGTMVEDLARALNDTDPSSQEAAALALSQSPDPAAASLLTQKPNLAARIQAGTLQWP